MYKIYWFAEYEIRTPDGTYTVHWKREIKPEHKELVNSLDAVKHGLPAPPPEGMVIARNEHGTKTMGAWHRHFIYTLL